MDEQQVTERQREDRGLGGRPDKERPGETERETEREGGSGNESGKK